METMISTREFLKKTNLYLRNKKNTCARARKWKFASNNVFPNIAIAEHNGEIVGANHSLPIKIKIGNKILKCNQAADLAIHPDYRGMKLYQRMTLVKQKHHKKNGDNLTFSVTHVPRVIEIAKKMGRPTFPKQVKRLVRIKDINLHVDMNKSQNPVLKKIGFTVMDTLNKITSLERKHEQKTDLLSEEITQFDENYAIAWDKVKDHYDFIIEKTPEYLNWRYFDLRGGNYIVKHVVDDSGVVGYIVLRVNRYVPEYSYGCIVDFGYLPERLDVVRVLLSDAIKYFDKLGLNFVYTWGLEGHPHFEILKRYGFFDSKNSPVIHFNTYNVGAEWESFVNSPSSRLSIQVGDTDWT